MTSSKNGLTSSQSLYFSDLNEFRVFVWQTEKKTQNSITNDKDTLPCQYCLSECTSESASERVNVQILAFLTTRLCATTTVSMFVCSVNIVHTITIAGS